MVARRRWSDLSERSRRLIVLSAVVEGILKIAALIDLRRRPADQLRGSKRAWATALVLVSSLGLVPLGYFVFGRKSGALARTGS